jgi:hypothetical protein
MFNFGSTLNANNTEMFRHAMAERYRQENTKSKLLGLWAFISRRSAKLQNLQAVAARQTITNRHYVGLQTVAINQITGSENHHPAFDAQFRPANSWNQQRWINMAIAYDSGIPMPPVELIQIGQAYFVRDGHHRISVAKLFGREFIEAEVTVWQTEPVAQPMPSQPKPVFHPQPQTECCAPAICLPASAGTCH